MDRTVFQVGYAFRHSSILEANMFP